MQPFDPHPDWRRNFEFTAQYERLDNRYRLDPILAHKQILEFVIDATIHKFSLANAQIHNSSTPVA